MKVILFGGAFDPPHLGHEQVAKELVEKKIADQVWFVPVGSHAFDKNLAAVEHRLKMLELILPPHTRIERFEVDHPGVSYTLDTLKEMSRLYPRDEFFWVIGSDNLPKFHLWDDGKGNSFEVMLASYKFYVYPRVGFPFFPLYDNMITLDQLTSVDVSSTEIRRRVKAGQSCQNLVSPAVAEYIRENGLYQ
ncbi:MAG: nicotinate (nicotinamide) nucleotide adenylyltransferase [Patescibacteria group bacterium]